MIGVNHHRVFCGLEWSHGSLRVYAISLLHRRQDLRVIGGLTAGTNLVVAAFGPHLRRGGEVDLEVGLGQDNGADVPPHQHHLAAQADLALALLEGLTHPRHRRYG